MPHQAAVSQVSWEKVADSIEFIPDQYSDRTQPESVAREMLGCDAADIDTLVEGGLPFEDRAGVRCFDANDLYNLGMYSGRSTTQPELAFRMLFRFAGRPSTISCARSPGPSGSAWSASTAPAWRPGTSKRRTSSASAGASRR
ncbi:hypothetical protein F3K39_42900 [Streptomyces sp. LBUM 1479]|nr:hypothetical protein [Streptomyces sp. LBUM 1479]